MSAAAAARPIRVSTLGVGGLTVVRALMERLPLRGHRVLPVTTARVPGVKSVATIEHFTAQITEFLLQRDVEDADHRVQHHGGGGSGRGAPPGRRHPV